MTLVPAYVVEGSVTAAREKMVVVLVRWGYSS
jgi:hypothetical protein